jgi:GTP cyclohydrolase FolE2
VNPAASSARASRSEVEVDGVLLARGAVAQLHRVATFNMCVSLPHDFKGTHMSRFVQILHAEREISMQSLRGMLRTMTGRLEAETGHIEMSFPFFVMKRAPVSPTTSARTSPSL